MLRYRLTRTARKDTAAILAWSHAQFGAEARMRYQGLIVAALRDIARSGDGSGATPRPELGAGTFTWHLRSSRSRSGAGVVHRPRHFVIYRIDGDFVIIGRVLHDAMELRRHLDADTFRQA